MSERPKRRLMYNKPEGEVIGANYDADEADAVFDTLKARYTEQAKTIARLRDARSTIERLVPALSNINERNADGSVPYCTAVWLPDVLSILDAALEEEKKWE